MDHIIYNLVGFGFNTVLLVVTLWIMILFQRMNYNFLGLIGTAVASGLLELIPIPYVGHLCSVAMLYYGIGKMTGASRFPDVTFTVVLSWALMFAAKVLLFTALIGDLRPDLNPAEMKPPGSPAIEPQLLPQATNAVNLPASHGGSSPTKANSKAVAKFLEQLVIKGAMVNGQKSSATVQYGGKNYVIFLGETVSLPAKDESMQLKLEKVTRQSLTFSVNGEMASCAYK